ncbi:MAG: extracytoplasmic sigma factor ECF [Planctomycetota bacterium]|nr:MAG: extracytoplasmic sigma factor ECF [Planctomycetota bacterium]
MSAKNAVDGVLPELYDELRKLAERALANDRPGHTLQPTALVHEAYMRLITQRKSALNDRAYAYAAASCLIRRILIDHARKHRAAKRFGRLVRVNLTPQLVLTHSDDLDVLAVHEALEQLERLDARQARVVELRFFGGLTVEEIARVMELSKRTVEGDWALAKAWLKRELTRDASG